MSQIHTLILISFYLLISPSSSTATTTPYTKPDPNSYKSFIQTACSTATYPSLCSQTCLPYAANIKADPLKLVVSALSATLKATQSSVTIVKTLSKENSLGEYETNAIKDCIENMGDSIDDIKKSISLVKDLKAGSKSRNELKFKISSVLTWMSAAITDDDTCMDGIGEKNRVGPVVKSKVRECVLGVVKLTSNALSLCNHIDYS